MTTSLADLTAAHNEVILVIRAIPDIALDWRSSGDDWSIKQIIGHLAHANDFYIMIVAEVRATAFGIVKLNPELTGWRNMAATDAAIAQCSTISAILEYFERTYHEMWTVLRNLTNVELDQPFVFCQPDKEPYTTTLRQRVIQMAPSHLREHQLQLSRTLAGWNLHEGRSYNDVSFV